MRINVTVHAPLGLMAAVDPVKILQLAHAGAFKLAVATRIIDQNIIPSPLSGYHPGATGRLFSMLEPAKKTPTGAIIHIRGKKAIYVEYGTRPHTAPWKAIAKWAKRVGIEPFPIWYGIKTKGTKGQFYMTRSWTWATKNAVRIIEAEFRKAGY